MSPEERAQRTLKMEEIEAERDLVEGIRAGVAAAAKVGNKEVEVGHGKCVFSCSSDDPLFLTCV